MLGKIIAWNTILSFPIKCTNFVSSDFQYGSQSFPSLSAHSLVAEMYPIGASNQTYSTFPSAPSSGTGIPQSKSRVTALGCKPSSNQDLHCPCTLCFQSSLWSTKIHCTNHSWCSFNGKNQCFVDFSSGLFPVIALLGSIRSVALWEVPQLSH